MAPTEKKWVVISGMKGASPAILRVRENISAEERGKFNGFMLMQWVYDGGASGMPDQPTQLRMGDFEEKLDALEEKGLCSHVIVHTHNNKAEFFVYVAEPYKFAEELAAELENIPEELPIGVKHYSDPEWEGYAHWKKLAESQATGGVQ